MPADLERSPFENVQQSTSQLHILEGTESVAEGRRRHRIYWKKLHRTSLSLCLWLTWKVNINDAGKYLLPVNRKNNMLSLFVAIHLSVGISFKIALVASKLLSTNVDHCRPLRANYCQLLPSTVSYCQSFATIFCLSVTISSKISK